jgi:flagellar basal body-associated protein FliL
VLIVVLVLILLGGAVLGTLFAVGFFDSKTDAESAIAAMEDAENSGAEVNDQQRQDEAIKVIDDEGLKYLEIEPELLSNLHNSQRMIQVKIAVMVKQNEDKTLLRLIEKHAYPVRSQLLKILSEKREDQVSREGFRDNLALELKNAMNDVLETRIGDRDIQELYFIEFIVQ